MRQKSISRDRTPLIAFTSGDPSGIGPETVIGALRSPGLRRACRPLLVGEASVWRRAGWSKGEFPLLDTGLGFKVPRYGIDSREGGAASYEAVRRAVRLAARGVVSGIVTAPISKAAWKLARVPHADHTEFLARETGCRVQMLLGLPRRRIWSVIVTRHCPLRDAPRLLNPGAVAAAALTLNIALRTLWGRKPRLGLCGLNPHGGERGLFGSEERRILKPALMRARSLGLAIEGPLPADTAWRRHFAGEFDGLVALYHDQAMIPLKSVGGLEVVNWTAGLPFVRTSPGHGTGYDIAGRGAPSPAATLAAAELACRIIKKR